MRTSNVRPNGGAAGEGDEADAVGEKPATGLLADRRRKKTFGLRRAFQFASNAS